MIILLADILALFVQQMKATMRQLITTPAKSARSFARGAKLAASPSRAWRPSSASAKAACPPSKQYPAGLTLDRLIVLAKLLGLELVLQDKSDKSGKQPEW